MPFQTDPSILPCLTSRPCDRAAGVYLLSEFGSDPPTLHPGSGEFRRTSDDATQSYGLGKV
mgnify:CR=1 FL=1